MAERSKALASGASREICVGSNPTLVIILFCCELSFLLLYVLLLDKTLLGYDFVEMLMLQVLDDFVLGISSRV
jgi:hypothetical protein